MRAPAQGRQREEQADPPHPKKKVQKQTNSTDEKKKGGGGKRQTHSREAAHSFHKRRANPPARQHRRRHQRGALKERWRTALPTLASLSQEQRPTAQKDTPDTPAHTPLEEWRAEKKMGAAQTTGEGGTETKSPKTGTRSAGHHKATTRQGPKPHTPQSPEKKQKVRGGGHKRPTVIPAHPHATSSPTRRMRETDAAHARGHTPQHPS